MKSRSTLAFSRLRPEITSMRAGSPARTSSILITSAPQSANTAPAEGTKVHDASSTTRTPSMGPGMSPCLLNPVPPTSSAYCNPYSRWRQQAGRSISSVDWVGQIGRGGQRSRESEESKHVIEVRAAHRAAQGGADRPLDHGGGEADQQLGVDGGQPALGERERPRLNRDLPQHQLSRAQPGRHDVFVQRPLAAAGVDVGVAEVLVDLEVGDDPDQVEHAP